MGFFDTLIAFGQAAGELSHYYSKYNAYDDEELVDEFYRLWKIKHNYESTDYDDIKLKIVKQIIDSRELFDLN